MDVKDTIELKLPISEKLVVVRNYTTKGDESIANSILYRGVDIQSSGLMDIPFVNTLANNECWVKLLVKSIDGSTEDLENKLNALRSPDYKYIFEAVDKIVEGDTNDPKESGVESPEKPAPSTN